MTDSGPTEKRSRQRLLCSDPFSGCTLNYDGTEYSAQSINYNQCGIGVFAMTRLPEQARCQLRFCYRSDEDNIEINALAAERVYSNETEVGHQYGFKFCLEEASAEVRARLIALEERLEQDAKTHRYGLFS